MCCRFQERNSIGAECYRWETESRLRCLRFTLILLCTSGSAELIALGFLSLSFRRTADCRSLFYSSYGFELDGITHTHFRTSGLFSIRFLIRFWLIDWYNASLIVERNTFLLFTFVTLLDFLSFSRKINSSVANLTNKDHRDCYRCNNRQTGLHRKRGKTLFLSMIVSTLQLQYSLFLSLSFARSETSSIETVSTGSTFVFNNFLEKGWDKLPTQ